MKIYYLCGKINGMEPRKYQFNNSTLTIIFGNILTSKAEVIASSDDTWITMGGGVSKCILNAGGEIIRQDARKKLPVQIGDVVVSTAGNLTHQKFIFHCMTLDRGHDGKSSSEGDADKNDLHKYIVQHSIDKCFKLLQALDLSSMAFPSIGAGSAHIPLQKVACVMADAISANLCRTQRQYNIELYLYDRYHALTEMDYIDMFENFAVRAAMMRHMGKMLTDKMKSEVSSNVAVTNVPRRAEMTHQVFISYSRKDAEKTSIIVKALEECGIPYWIDMKGVYSGENYKEVIVDAIDVAKAVVFISSANSNASINVVRELGYAVKQEKTIIPVLLDDSQYAKSIRLDIADIDQVEYSDTEYMKKKLLASLAYSLGK